MTGRPLPHYHIVRSAGSFAITSTHRLVRKRTHQNAQRVYWRPRAETDNRLPLRLFIQFKAFAQVREQRWLAAIPRRERRIN